MSIITTIIKPWRALYLLSILSLILLVLSNVVWGLMYRDLLGSAREVVYVATPGGTYPLRLSSSETLRPWEAENHVLQFTQLMFSHDEQSYDERIAEALYLIDKQDGLGILREFEENHIREDYLKYGSRTVLDIEELEFSSEKFPIQGQVICRLRVLFSDQQSILKLKARFSLVPTHRSKHNPYGLLIKDWRIMHSKWEQKGGPHD